MQTNDKVKRLLQEGKINAEQAALLLNALEESEKRRQKNIQQVLVQRKARGVQKWALLGIFLLVVFVCVMGLAAVLNTGCGLDRNVYKALDNFSLAGAALDNAGYKEALDYCGKGIGAAPDFFIGYVINGAINGILYEQTKDQLFKQRQEENFRKAVRLSGRVDKRARLRRTAVVFGFISLLILLAVVAVIGMFLYNQIVAKEEAIEVAWVQVKNLQQQKISLMPVLLEAAKGSAAAPGRAVENAGQSVAEVLKLSAMQSAQGLTQQDAERFLKIQEQINSALQRLSAVSENKADAYGRAIIKELTEAEDGIVRGLRECNNRIQRYNACIRYFPANIVAALLRFESRVYALQPKGR